MSEHANQLHEAGFTDQQVTALVVILSDINARLVHLEARLDTLIVATEARFTAIEGRLDRLERKVNWMLAWMAVMTISQIVVIAKLFSL